MNTGLWLRRNLWLVGVVIYVVGMYPIFASYEVLHSYNFTVIDAVSVAALFLVIIQAVIAPYEETLPAKVGAEGKQRSGA